MDLEQIIEEMERKPDAGILLDWIWDQVCDGSPADVRQPIVDAIAAYQDGISH